jgi:hypothetical protein
MAVFPLVALKSRVLSLSRASIPEMCRQCDRLQAFLGACPVYLGDESRGLTKREVDNGKRKPYDATSHYVREPIR